MPRAYEGKRDAKLAVRTNFLPPPAGSNPAYQKQWKQIVEDFPPARFRQSDIPLLDAYVKLLIEMNGLYQQLTSQDRIVITKAGPKVNPVFTMYAALLSKAVTIAKALRVSPVSRTDLRNGKFESPADEDDMEQEAKKKQDDLGLDIH